MIVSETPQCLSPAQVEQFHRDGYVAGIPIFTEAELEPLRGEYLRAVRELPAGTNINFVNWWHKLNRVMYDACMDPRLLDCVEQLLGPDFFLWGSQFFAKEPGDEYVVPWHQDAQYWPLSPHESCTGFIALWDVDRENACMEVVPGTHRAGLLQHHRREKGKLVLEQELDSREFDAGRAVPLILKAGQISLHDDAIVHGSGPNRSPRRRVGFTMRFSTTRVKCDLAVWPTFRAFLARGEDRYGHNPAGQVPTGCEIPITMRP